MISLKDLTVVIPFRYDSQDRLDNLTCVLRYFRTFFSDLDIVLIEDGPEQRGGEFEGGAGVRYLFFENSGTLHRTRLLNLGVRMSKRKLVVAYDTDVILPLEAIFQTLAMFDSERVSLVYPYGGVTLNICGDARNDLMSSFNMEGLLNVSAKKVGDEVLPEVFCTHLMSLGCAVFFRRDRFLSLGGYNERFLSWGWEDNEILERFKIMGEGTQRILGFPALHLDHFRGPDSRAQNPFYRHNMREFRRVKRMSRKTLVAYIETYLKGSNVIHLGVKRAGLFSRFLQLVRDVQCPHCLGKIDIDVMEVYK